MHELIHASRKWPAPILEKTMTARSKLICLVFAAAAMTSACSSDIAGVPADPNALIREQSERDRNRETEIQTGVNKCAVYRNELCPRP